MKRFYLFTILIAVASALLITFTACGGVEDEGGVNEEHTEGCQDICRKASECNELRFFGEFDDVQDCVNDCWEIYDGEIKCMIDCDVDLSCDAYAECILDC